jgi:hypothetical protein
MNRCNKQFGPLKLSFYVLKKNEPSMSSKFRRARNFLSDNSYLQQKSLTTTKAAFMIVAHLSNISCRVKEEEHFKPKDFLCYKKHI